MIEVRELSTELTSQGRQYMVYHVAIPLKFVKDSEGEGVLFWLYRLLHHVAMYPACGNLTLAVALHRATLAIDKCQLMKEGEQLGEQQ